MVLVFVFERKEIRCRYVLNLGLASWLASGVGLGSLFIHC